MAANSRKGLSQNRKLFCDGESYLPLLRPASQGRYTTEELDPIASQYHTSVSELRTAIEFVDAVNQIAKIAGASAKKLILSGKHPLLTPVLIHKLCRRTPEHLRVALRQAADGLHPLARP